MGWLLVRLTELSSISLIFLSLPAAIKVFISGVAATALQQEGITQCRQCVNVNNCTLVAPRTYAW